MSLNFLIEDELIDHFTSSYMVIRLNGCSIPPPPPLSSFRLFGYFGRGEASPATSSGRALFHERHESISPDTSLTTQVGVKPPIRFILLIGPFPVLT